jgi:hypothetical protein
MSNPSYRQAIQWIAYEDDTDFLNDEKPSLSVTASMVADLYQKTHEQVLKSLYKAVEERDK